MALAGGVNMARFTAFWDRDVELTGKDKEMGAGTGPLASWPNSLVPALRHAWEDGSSVPHGEIAPGIRFSSNRSFFDFGDGVVGFRIIHWEFRVPGTSPYLTNHQLPPGPKSSSGRLRASYVWVVGGLWQAERGLVSACVAADAACGRARLLVGDTAELCRQR